MKIRLILSLWAVALLALSVPARTDARTKVYMPGYYIGRTSQGDTISFVVAHGSVSGLFVYLTDSCGSTKWYVTLHPKAARINAQGFWSRRTPGSLPTIYHGHISGSSATGTIDDLSKNNAGRLCRGHVSFGARRGSPLSTGPATVGPRGTDVLLRLRVPAINNGNGYVPDTSLAILVYGSNTGCPATYRSADAMARSRQSFGFIGLISDAYVTADYGSALTRSYRNGTFIFDVNTNTLLRTPSGRSPFSTVCEMLYSGEPATLTPGHNIALETVHGPLVRGPGIPNSQP